MRDDVIEPGNHEQTDGCPTCGRYHSQWNIPHENAKVCDVCGECKLLADFPKDRDSSDGHLRICMACRAQKLRDLQDNTLMRTCAGCGEEKSLAHFDPRFIQKKVKLFCTECRKRRTDLANQRWQTEPQPWRAEQRRLRAEQDRLRAEEAEQDWLRAEQEELLAREEKYRERQRQHETWKAFLQQIVFHATELGFTKAECAEISHIHRTIRYFGIPWDELKQRFSQLHPPYYESTQRSLRRQLGSALKRQLFQEQGGRCFYCHVELAPLDTNRPHELKEYRQHYRTFRSEQHTLEEWEAFRASREHRKYRDTLFAWRKGVGLRIAHIEHKTPISRGGTNERENLVLACAKCNTNKGVRTEAELSFYPQDPISLLRVHPNTVATALAYEHRDYDYFNMTPLREHRADSLLAVGYTVRITANDSFST